MNFAGAGFILAQTIIENSASASGISYYSRAGTAASHAYTLRAEGSSLNPPPPDPIEEFLNMEVEIVDD